MPYDSDSAKKARKKAKPRGPNKVTKTVKETFLNVFNEIQSDPKIKLSAFARKYPRDFYQLSTKLIPTEITGKLDTKITITVKAKKP